MNTEELLFDRLGALLGVAELVVRQPRQHRLIRIRLRGDVLVTLFDEQPLFRSLLEFDQGPATAQFVAAELEQQLPFFQTFVWVFERNPHAAVPDDDGAGAVIPFGNHALEVAVLERVVFDADGETLIGWICGRTFGDRPRHEHAVHFETQIPMQPRRIVHVHDQQAPGFRRGFGV